MTEIGGYFELELRKGNEYHSTAIALNTARNALELILITKNYSKVYIPYFTCDVILEPFKKQNIEYEFYHIDEDLEPKFDYLKIKENEGLLYTNYFGIKDKFIGELTGVCRNLIVDNSQSFFSKPINDIPTFYSCRKFFGVPDGAYLYMEGVTTGELPCDYSENRMTHLLKRIEYDAEVGYVDFKTNDNSLVGQPIRQMSKLTKALLSNIDYEFVKTKRIENFNSLHNILVQRNELNFELENNYVPMVYPFLTKKHGLKEKLIRNKIYVATYWPNVLNWVKEDSFENKLTNNLVHLPIDQRYGHEEMLKIFSLINEHA